MDDTHDDYRSFILFSPKDLARWRLVKAAGENAMAKDIAQANGILPSSLSMSCTKVEDYIAITVREMLKRE